MNTQNNNRVIAEKAQALVDKLEDKCFTQGGRRGDVIVLWDDFYREIEELKTELYKISNDNE